MRRLAIALAVAGAALASYLVAIGPASSSSAMSQRRAHHPTETTTWTIPVSETDTSIFAYKLAGVPAGSYLGTVSGLIYTGALDLQCVVTTKGLGHPLVGDDTAAIQGVHLVNAARTFRLAKRQTLLLVCVTPEPASFDTIKKFPLEVSLTRLDGITRETARHTIIKSASARELVLPRRP